MDANDIVEEIKELFGRTDQSPEKTLSDLEYIAEEAESFADAIRADLKRRES